MNLKSKKIILVILSLAFGGIVILGATKFSNILGSNDKKNNEWGDGLSVLPSDSDLLGAGKKNLLTEGLATSTTDIISRKLILEYTQSQKGSGTTTMSTADITRIATSLAQEIKLPEKRDYKLSDLNISKDNSVEAKLAYKQAITSLGMDHIAAEKKENELMILVSAMEKKDPIILERLRGKIQMYQDFINRLIALKTPSSASSIHLHYLQTYETLRVATEGFQSILTDSAIGNASLAEYKTGVEELPLVGQEYHDFFAK